MVFWTKSHFYMIQTLARRVGMAGSNCGMAVDCQGSEQGDVAKTFGHFER